MDLGEVENRVDLAALRLGRVALSVPKPFSGSGSHADE
jgi:hypothetical protein